MKFAAIAILAPVLFAQCSRKVETSHFPDKGRESIVYNGPGAPVSEYQILWEQTQSGVEESSAMRVRGRVMVLTPYCGGAAPSPEIELMANTPQPLPDFPIMIWLQAAGNDSLERAWELMTDQDGFWEANLPAGKYCLFAGEKAKVDPVIPQKGNEWLVIDEECYTKWLKTCDLAFVVQAGMEQDLHLLTLARRCYTHAFDPCTQYNGPIRP